MTLVELLEKLRAAEARVVLKDSQSLLLRGKALPPDLIAAVKEHKAELIAFLRESAALPLVAQDRGDTAPLAWPQQRLWVLDRLEPNTATYNMAMSSSVRGCLDTEALRAAYTAVLERHEVLRTRFELHGDEGVQVVCSPAESGFVVQDLNGFSPEQMDDYVAELAARPFDLSAAAPLCLYALAASNEARIVLVIHHILFDMASAEVFFSDLATAYSQQVSGQGAALPPLELQYADFALWQREQLNPTFMDSLSDFWIEQLDGAPTVLELPAENPLSHVSRDDDSGGWLARYLPPDVQARLQQYAAASGCSEQMIVFAAFQLLLNIYTGADDLLIGVPADLRDRSELKGQIGFYLNTLAVRGQVNSAMSFAELVDAARESMLAAHEHRQLPFEVLVERIDPERDLNMTPLVQVLFTWHRGEALGFDLSGVEATKPELVGQGTSKFDLSLIAEQADAGINLGFEYRDALFDKSSIEQMLDFMERLLRTCLTEPEWPLAELELLDRGEEQQLIERTNPKLDKRSSLCVHQLFEQQVDRTPDVIALEGPDFSLSYAELDAVANQLAHHLRSLGAGSDTRVAVITGRGRNFPLALLGVLKTGAAYVPLDSALPDARLEYMLTDSAPCVVLTESHLRARVPDLSAAVISLDEFSGDIDSSSRLDLSIETSSPGYLIYTSGSTGLPKATMLPHSVLVNLVKWQHTQAGLDNGCRVLHYASLSFDVSYTEPFTTWGQGGTLLTVDADTRLDFHALTKYLIEHGIERLFLPLAALQPLAEVQTPETCKALMLNDVIVSGEQLRITRSIRDFFEQLGRIRLHNHYGPAETHVVSALTLSGDPQAWPAVPSVGVPVKNSRLYILDPHMRTLPAGLPGELYIGGHVLDQSSGYFGKEEMTAERYIPDPFAADPNARMYKTGDRVRMAADGEYYFLGRLDHQLKIRGFRIEPGEVEVALTAMPEISEAVAVGLRDQAGGSARLVAYLQGPDIDAINIRIVRETLSRQLPAYMIPSAFVVLDKFPVSPTGKLDRHALPAPVDAGARAEYVAPATKMQENITSIFGEVLNIDKVGIDDNFFDLGGHSLAGIRVTARILERLALELPLKYLFQYPTPAGLAEACEVLQQAVAQPKGADDGEQLVL